MASSNRQYITPRKLFQDDQDAVEVDDQQGVCNFIILPDLPMQRFDLKRITMEKWANRPSKSSDQKVFKKSERISQTTQNVTNCFNSLLEELEEDKIKFIKSLEEKKRGEINNNNVEEVASENSKIFDELENNKQDITDLFENALVWFSSISTIKTESNEPVTKQEKSPGNTQSSTCENADSDRSSNQFNLLKFLIEQMDFHLNIDISSLNICPDPSSLYPAICKMLALRSMIDGDKDTAIFWLSLSHAYHLVQDMIDNYYEQIRDFKTNISRDKNLSLDSFRGEVKKCKLRKCILKDIRNFRGNDDCLKNFNDILQNMDSDWNIIQITTQPKCSNRFSTDINKPLKDPGFWLTSFYAPPGKKRETALVFCNPPVDFPESIMERFQRLIYLNKNLSNGYKGTRENYWETRRVHNSVLLNLLTEIESLWLSPYTFLLLGNLKDRGLVEKIWRFVWSVGSQLSGFQISSAILLYKLTENWWVFEPKDEYLLKLPKIVKLILPVGNRVAGQIAGRITKYFSPSSQNYCTDRYPTILILDKEIETIPWDWLPVLQSTDVTRVQSIHHINILLKVNNTTISKYPSYVDPQRVSFVLNPCRTLNDVQFRLEAFLSARKNWLGIIQKWPKSAVFQDLLETQDAFIYCGHGHGSHLYPENAIGRLHCRAVPFLFGCSSAGTKFHGHLSQNTSILNQYSLALCPSFVGFLWEVTDVECDRITVELIHRWLPDSNIMETKINIPNFTLDGKSEETFLPKAVRLSRLGATQFLTQAALVNYGLPVSSMNLKRALKDNQNIK